MLVVGAGPTGLMLANQLVRRGVRTLIVDRNPGPSVRTKALGVQARTLEIYSQLGIAQQALELGTRAIGANLWADGQRAARIPLNDIGRDLSPFPYLLILGQDDNERLLGNALRERGIDVQWNTELVDLTQNAEHARATLKRADGSTLQIDAPWIAGCDGPRSSVRSLTTIDFPGAPYEHVFFVADAAMHRPDGARRAERLPVARRFSSVLPDARKGSLACRWHRAARAARSRRSRVRRGVAGGAARRRAAPVAADLQLVLDLPHSSSPRRAVPRGPLLPARRCRAHPQPRRRAGHEHRAAGRLQPRRGSSRSSRRAAPTPRCSTRTRASAFRSPIVC